MDTLGTSIRLRFAISGNPMIPAVALATHAATKVSQLGVKPLSLASLVPLSKSRRIAQAVLISVDSIIKGALLSFHKRLLLPLLRHHYLIMDQSLIQLTLVRPIRQH